MTEKQSTQSEPSHATPVIIVQSERWASKQLKKLRKLFSGRYYLEPIKDPGAHRISTKIYRVLWFAGLFGAISGYYELQHQNLLGISDYFAMALGFLTLGQQSTVYEDLHRLEDYDDHRRVEEGKRIKREYRNWIDIRIERLLRAAIITALLFGVGKVANAFYPIVQFLHYLIDYLANFTAAYVLTDTDWLSMLTGATKSADKFMTFLEGFLHPKGEVIDLNRSLFVLGSLAAFLLLLTWNAAALYRRTCKPKLFTGAFREQLTAGSTSPIVYAEEAVINFRIISFIFLTLIATVYWGVVYFGYAGAGIAPYIVGLYILMFVIFTYFRFGKRHDLLKSFKRHSKPHRTPTGSKNKP